jgi:polyhydroxyalkanoate synthase
MGLGQRGVGRDGGVERSVDGHEPVGTHELVEFEVVHMAPGAALRPVQHHEDVTGVDVHLRHGIAPGAVLGGPRVDAESLGQHGRRGVVPSGYVHPQDRAVGRERAQFVRGVARDAVRRDAQDLHPCSLAIPRKGEAAASGQWEPALSRPSLGQHGLMAEESPHRPWDVAERAASVLGPEADLVEQLDSAGFGEALTRVARAAAVRPELPAQAALRLAGDLSRIPLIAATHWLGRDVSPPVPPDPKDRRFADPTWNDNPAFYGLRLSYLAACRFARDLVASADLEDDTARKAAAATELMLDALAPTNFLPTNPTALKRAFETGGASLIRGGWNFVQDVLTNQGRPRQVDTRPFEVGRNLAVTPAKVVYRNHLMELLQYEPQTEQVHASPLLCSPPWINKYYVMDLAPGRSFIEWAVQHGRTVFAISYRNPSKEMAAVTMDDYLVHGPQTALDVIQEITGAETIDIVGLCLGGAITAITDAFLQQAGDSRVGTLTLLNTMLDYAQPGALGMFTDRQTVDRLERRMQREGGLEGQSMAGTFDVLRANDLIFNYVVSNWLLGQDPPAFDILAWNADSTRMPAAMHAFYLRNFYVENNLAAGRLEIAGRTIDLSTIKSPTYVVSAINDHIVPWQSSYKTVGLVSGPVRFVLSSGGHIAGIVNPPGPKAWYEVAPGDDALPVDATAWRGSAQRQKGSWWEDWAAWSAENSGPLQDPPAIGSREHPVLEDGPGSYVRG